MSFQHRALAIGALVLGSLLVHPTSAADPPTGRQLAVVVGVNTYRANAGLPALQYAAADARRLSEALRRSGFKVVEMSHGVAREPGKEIYAPNLEYIRDQISGVLESPNLGEHDSILISLHGHGVQFDWEDAQGKKTPRFYFCPANATISGVKTANDLTERNYLLPLDELYEQLGKCRAATRLLIVDACRNDPTRPEGLRASELVSLTMPKLAPPPGGLVAFFSCQPNQRAVEDKKLGHGVFTNFLVQGLEGKADLPLAGKPADGVLTLSEIATYVANNTYAYVLEEYNGRKQSPELRGEFDLNLPLAWAGRPAGDLRADNGLKLKLVWCPPGKFMMGSPESDSDAQDDEKPQHAVTLTQGFWLGQTEVTQAQWEQVMGTKPWQGKDRVKEGANYAASYLSYEDALEFCRKLTEQERRAGRLGASEHYMLPTEAQWEYACRAGTTTVFSFGDDASTLSEYAWWGGIFGERAEYAHEVGQKKANAWGLYDMHGNVHEWCLDWYDEDYYGKSPVNDPTGPPTGSDRVYRGGSWLYSPAVWRSATRGWYSPDSRYSTLGFRVSLVP